jgi:predicted PurR-regulated permease PerM
MPPSRPDGAVPFSSLLLVAGLCASLFFARALLIPLAFALTLSFILLPLVTRLEKMRVPRTLAVSLATAVTGIVLTSGAYFVTMKVTAVASTVQAAKPDIERRIASFHAATPGSLNSAADTIEDLTLEFLQPDFFSSVAVTPIRVVDTKQKQFDVAVRDVRDFLTPMGDAGVVLIFSLIMLMKREELRHRLLLVAGLDNLNLVSRALAEAADRISLYLLVQLQIDASYGLLFGLGLFALHVPYAALWGLIAGVFRIVPFVGTFASMLLPLILALAIAPGWAMPVSVFVLFFVLELVAANVVEPYLFSTRGSAIFWSTIWGWRGLILSTPLTVCFVVLGRHVPQFRVLHSLLGTTAALSPPGHLYERLLAMDQAGAWEVVEKSLRTTSLLRFYDDVLLPVLVLAEGDTHKGVLDDKQAKFIHLCVEDIMLRMPVLVHLEEATSKSERSLLIETMRKPLRKEFAVVCLSAGRKADTLTAMMLSQLLERSSFQALVLAPESVSDEILEALSSEPNTVIILCAVSPLAFGRTRSVYQHLRIHMPENRIGVALWKAEEDPDELLARLGDPKHTATFTSFNQAITRTKRWQEETPKA